MTDHTAAAQADKSSRRETRSRLFLKYVGLFVAVVCVALLINGLLEVWGRGEIDPPVGATFPLADANEAHALIESRRHVGKVVLEP